MKSHTEVSVEEGELLAAFTSIETTDKSQPSLIRHLWQDKLERLLVVRQSTNITADQFSTTFERVGTGELVAISITGTTVQVTMGGGSFEFEDGDQGDSSVRADFASLLDGHAELTDALRELTKIGLNYAIDIRTPALILQQMVFPELEAPFSPSSETSLSEVLDKEFEAAASAPNDFEAQFGIHYYE